MKYVANAKEMKAWDQWTIRERGVPSRTLMEQAALAARNVLEEFPLDNVLLVCGTGNNGGDGMALARFLKEAGYSVEVLLVGARERCTKDAAEQLALLEACGGEVLSQVTDWSLYTTIVDALFGIGLNRSVEGVYADCVKQMNSAPAPVLSLDIPSGICADSGQILGVAVRAHTTVTYTCLKRGLLFYPGTSYAGRVLVRSIGISLVPNSTLALPRMISYGSEDLSRLPKRLPSGNKGTFGKVFVIAGSSGMCGAAFFTAKAAYRCGAGLVRILTAPENRVVLQTILPEAIVDSTEPGDDLEKRLASLLAWASAVVIGPGLGMDETAQFLVRCVLRDAPVPVVVDADALNGIARDPALRNLLPGSSKSPRIVTPHIGEMARLLGETCEQVADAQAEKAESFAAQYGVVCVLKDARTVVATGNMEHIYVNRSGNHGMATGGSGDVLSGVLGALLAQGMEVSEAARLGVYLHGLAGDKAASAQSAYSMMASDLLDALPHVFRTGEAIMQRETKEVWES